MQTSTRYQFTAFLKFHGYSNLHPLASFLPEDLFDEAFFWFFFCFFTEPFLLGFFGWLEKLFGVLCFEIELLLLSFFDKLGVDLSPFWELALESLGAELLLVSESF